MYAVSILIPCYQERNFIRACLDSVAAFELPGTVEVEILVLDGLSTDGTHEIIRELATLDTRIRLVENPGRTQAAAMNLGISMAKGEYVVRLDAHSVYPPDYLAVTLSTAERSGADNTGGTVDTLRRGDGYEAALVQALITHKFGVGNSGFRTDAPEGPADTVPYGCFRRNVFDKVGLFDERLVRAQDYEMNRRIVAAGGVVWRNPAIRIQYFPQPDFRSFISKQVLYEAPYNAYMWYLAPYAFAPRHAVTAVFAAGVIAGAVLSQLSTVVRPVFIGVMALYSLLAIAAGLHQAARYREPRHALFAPPAFFFYHFLHGIGVLAGLLKLALRVAPVQKGKEPWPGAGRRRAWPPGNSGRVHLS